MGTPKGQIRARGRSAAQESRPLMRVGELAAWLNLTRRVTYQWIATAVIPTTAIVRAGRNVYLKSAVIEDWLAGRNGQPGP